MVFGFGKGDLERLTECRAFITAGEDDLIRSKIGKIGQVSVLKDLSSDLIKAGKYSLAGESMKKVTGDENLTFLAIELIKKNQPLIAQEAISRITSDESLKNIVLAEIAEQHYPNAASLAKRVKVDSHLASISNAFLRAGQLEYAIDSAKLMNKDDEIRNITLAFIGALLTAKTQVDPRMGDLARSDKEILVNGIQDLAAKVKDKDVLKSITLALIGQREFASARICIDLLISKNIDDESLRGITRALIDQNHFDFARDIYSRVKDKQILKAIAIDLISAGQSQKAVSAIETLIEKKIDESSLSDIAIQLIQQGQFALANRVASAIKNEEIVANIFMAWARKVQESVAANAFTPSQLRESRSFLSILTQIKKVELLRDCAISLVQTRKAVFPVEISREESKDADFDLPVVETRGMNQEDLKVFAKTLLDKAIDVYENIPAEKGLPDICRKDILLAWIQIRKEETNSIRAMDLDNPIHLKGLKVLQEVNRKQITAALEGFRNSIISSQLRLYWNSNPEKNLFGFIIH